MGNNYKNLTDEEQDQIAVLKAVGKSVSHIGQILCRHKSSISRELTRNRSPVYHCYHATAAGKRAKQRKSEAGRRDRLKCPEIRRYVASKLELGWSPELIAGRIGVDHPDLRISHEAIYQYVYDPKIRKHLDLVPYLIRAHKKRQCRKHSRRHRKSHIPDRVSIDQRPSRVTDRKQPGHWEADTAISRQSKDALGVFLERTSRYPQLAKLPRKAAVPLRKALTRRLSRHPPHMRRTITYDNGSENVDHQQVNQVLGTRSYFCDPYCSWQRGSVENAIGLVRRYLPKKTDFAHVSKAQLKTIETRINNRPRKCLDFSTPAEVFKLTCCT
ncbi:MAG: IS30 family transposase [Bacteroidetes bacterium]|nr:IS30 family transposase [Bacteroidota bacterium]